MTRRWKGHQDHLWIWVWVLTSDGFFASGVDAYLRRAREDSSWLVQLQQLSWQVPQLSWRVSSSWLSPSWQLPWWIRLVSLSPSLTSYSSPVMWLRGWPLWWWWCPWWWWWGMCFFTSFFNPIYNSDCIVTKSESSCSFFFLSFLVFSAAFLAAISSCSST